MIYKSSLSDLPSNSDVNDFGTERYVNGLIRFIEHSSAPITIALQGEWGSGKTSLMNKLYDGLCGTDKKFIGININTWEYSMLSTPEQTVLKIIGKLVQELSKNDPKASSTVSRYLQGALKFAYNFGNEVIRGLAPGAGTVMNAVGIPQELSETKSSNHESVSLAQLRESLTSAIAKSISENQKEGVIVFVDDLDRLNPPLAVEILELLKNIFTLENCIFVLAIDYEVVVKGLKPKFGELTDKNEREFRSFFDKIIQVPFSLPVNNYEPMSFVLKSLVEINYLSELDTKDPNIRKLFTQIVDASVGKNPRSIKRLINTLSLIDCIEHCGSDGSDKQMSSDDKIINFIVVAMQICYPKIYRLLAKKSDFTSWDVEFATKMGVTIEVSNEINDNESIQWEDIVAVACRQDSFLTQHSNDIASLFSLILQVVGEDATEPIGDTMKRILNKSSITGVDSGFKADDLDAFDLIQKIHRKVIAYLKNKRPDIRHQLVRNTGKGGFYIWYQENSRIRVPFTPSINKKGQICLRIDLDMNLGRPERMKGMQFDEVMSDQTLGAAIKHIDAILAMLLSKSRWFFKGRTYKEQGFDTFFPSYVEELRHLYSIGGMKNNITFNPSYWIDLDKPSLFEDPQIIATIGDLLIANYEFRIATINCK